MTWFPDCRTDDNYNTEYLEDADKEFIKGFDFAVEQVLNLIDNNADVYPEFEELLDKDRCIINVDKVAIVHEAIENWLEGERNMMITSMIDHMDEDEYNAIKEEVNGRRKTAY